LNTAGQSIIEQNILALSVSGGGIRCDRDVAPIIRNNLTWDHVGGHGNGTCPGWWEENGNIVADPQFCDPRGGDWTLAEGSPGLTHPAGPLGARPNPGCVDAQPSRAKPRVSQRRH